MLVLSRKVGQEVMIGDSVRIVVVEIRRGQVRLAFAAPSDVAIHRHEVYQQIGEEAPGEEQIAGEAGGATEDSQPPRDRPLANCISV